MPQAAVGLRRCRRAPCERGAWRPEADHNLGPFEPKHPRSRRARRPGIPGAPASHWPCAPADRRRRRLLRRVPGTCIFPVVAAAPAMSPADALTGKGHVRYSPAFSTGLADPQEVDQRSPTSSCAQNSRSARPLSLSASSQRPRRTAALVRASPPWPITKRDCAQESPTLGRERRFGHASRVIAWAAGSWF